MSEKHNKYKAIRLDPDNLEELQKTVSRDISRPSLAQFANMILRDGLKHRRWARETAKAFLK